MHKSNVLAEASDRVSSEPVPANRQFSTIRWDWFAGFAIKVLDRPGPPRTAQDTKTAQDGSARPTADPANALGRFRVVWSA